MDLSKATRAQLQRASDLLRKWDRNHENAVDVAMRMQDGGVKFEASPDMCMPSEYMPGRRALLEAADPNDTAAVHRYIDEAFKKKSVGATDG